MKRQITTLLAGLLAATAFIPLTTARACDGACGGGNNINGHRHLKTSAQVGAGEGLNNGVNLSLDQNQQNRGQYHGIKWAGAHKGRVTPG